MPEPGKWGEPESPNQEISEHLTMGLSNRCCIAWYAPGGTEEGGLAAMSLWKFREEASELFLDVLFLDGRR